MNKNIHSIPLYQFYNKMLYWLCGQKWFQVVFHSHKLIAIHFFYDQQKPAMQENEFIRQVLFNNSGDVRKWVLFSNPVERILAHIHMEGEDNLLTEAKKGKGLILVNIHTGLSQAVHLVIKTMGLARDNYSISKTKQEDSQRKGNFEQVGEEDYAMQSIQAVEVLFKGGIVFLSIDGTKGGRHGIPVPFLGRWHVFKTGFAEMAIATGAPVMPVSASLLPDGSVQIRFHPLLNMGDEFKEKDFRIKGMITQLSAFIAQQWITLPTTIKYKRLLFHNRQPIVQDPVQIPIAVTEPNQGASIRRSLFHMVLMKIRRTKKKIIHKKTH